jgi:hypothetical protein
MTIANPLIGEEIYANGCISLPSQHIAVAAQDAMRWIMGGILIGVFCARWVLVR